MLPLVDAPERSPVLALYPRCDVAHLLYVQTYNVAAETATGGARGLTRLPT